MLKSCNVEPITFITFATLQHSNLLTITKKVFDFKNNHHIFAVLKNKRKRITKLYNGKS